MAAAVFCLFAGVAAAGERPLIGVTSTVDIEKKTNYVPWQYAKAVWEAGGVPLVIPNLHETPEVIDDYTARLDGLVIIGGKDIPPAAYGEKPHESVKVMPLARWEFDRRLIAAWLKTDKPILGICLGAQMTNVLLGGALVQDIPTQIGETVAHRKTIHAVNVLSGTRLASILGSERLEVYSNHHQAVKRLGRGLRICARADDGVVEATELAGDRWGVFVQWHPARMEESHRLKVFGSLVEASYRSSAAPSPETVSGTAPAQSSPSPESP